MIMSLEHETREDCLPSTVFSEPPLEISMHCGRCSPQAGAASDAQMVRVTERKNRLIQRYAQSRELPSIHEGIDQGWREWTASMQKERESGDACMETRVCGEPISRQDSVGRVTSSRRPRCGSCSYLLRSCTLLDHFRRGRGRRLSIVCFLDRLLSPALSFYDHL